MFESYKINPGHTKIPRNHENLKNRIDDEILAENFEIEYTTDAEIDKIIGDHENTLVTVENVDELLETSDEEDYNIDNEKSFKQDDISKPQSIYKDMDISDDILTKSDSLNESTSDYLVSILDEELFIKDEPLDVEENSLDQFNHIKQSHCDDYKPNNISENSLFSRSKIIKKAKSSPLREVWMVSPLKKPKYLVESEEEDTLPLDNYKFGKKIFEIGSCVGDEIFNVDDSIVAETESTESDNCNLKAKSNDNDLENNVLNEKEVFNSYCVQNSDSQDVINSSFQKQDTQKSTKNYLKCTQCSAKFNQLIQLERHQLAHFLHSVGSLIDEEKNTISDSR